MWKSLDCNGGASFWLGNMVLFPPPCAVHGLPFFEDTLVPKDIPPLGVNVLDFFAVFLPINLFACVMFIEKFTTSNGLRYHKITGRYKSRGNTPNNAFSVVYRCLVVYFEVQ